MSEVFRLSASHLTVYVALGLGRSNDAGSRVLAVSAASDFGIT